MALDPFDTLVAFKSDLLDWARQSAPRSDDERQRVQQVLALRDQLGEQLNALVGLDLETALAGLPGDAALLEKATETINSVQKNIASVQQVLDSAGTVVSVVAKLVTVVVAA
jgi:hypothetical protein